MFLHASRGRPEISMKTARNITESMRSGVPFTYYLSLDLDDPTLPRYYEETTKSQLISDVVLGENQGCVQATNRGATKYTDEDLIINMADDIGVNVVGWDVYVLKFIENIPNAEYLVHMPNATPNSHDTAVYQFLSGPLYKKLGYIFYPEYISMYADNDLWATSTALGVRYDFTTPPNPQLFIHNHPTYFREIQWDDTYTRTNRPMCYKQGEEIYKRRKAERFPIR